MTRPFERLSDSIRYYGRSRADHVAARFNGRSLTYGDLDALADRAALAFLACGAQPGDRVAMLSTPRLELLVVLLAAARSGLVWLGLNPKHTDAELAHVLEDCRPTTVLRLASLDSGPLDRALRIIEGKSIGLPKVLQFGHACAPAQSLRALLDLANASSTTALAHRDGSVEADSAALLVYTSGSTGRPKGALLSHYGLCAGSWLQSRHFRVRDPRVICNLPISHVGAIADICGTTLVVGGTIVFQERFCADDVLEAMERERISIWCGVPTMFQMTLERCPLLSPDLSSLELILWAGAAMPRPLLARLRSFAPRLMTAYGMTETSCHVAFTGEGATQDELAATVGRVDPDVAWRIAGTGGEACETGTAGELELRARTNALGYFEKPQATLETFTPDGWLRTGDIAVARPDGNLQLVGRLREMYKSGGYNIYPREIEVALETLPGVALAAVVEAADARFGQVGHAFVQPAPDAKLDLASLESGLRERLANYKIPKRFFIQRELPLLPIGKVDKQRLRSRSSS